MDAAVQVTLLDHLVLERCRVTFEVEEPVVLAPFPGAQLRGAFGRALRRTVCTTGLPTCPGCQLAVTCPYVYFFEPPLRLEEVPGRFRSTAPHPYVLQVDDPRMGLAPGDRYEFGLTLVGAGADFLPLIIPALVEMGRLGLNLGAARREAAGEGKRRAVRGRARLVSVTALLPDGEQPVYHVGGRTLLATFGRWTAREFREEAERLRKALAAGARLSLTLLTPTRLKADGEVAATLDFRLFVRTLLSRLSALVRFHCYGTVSEACAPLLAQAERVRVLGTARWEDWVRYSASQRQVMNLGGLVGSVELQGDLEPFLPYLVAGQYTHVGKNCTFGLGRYVLEAGSVRA